MQPLETVAIDEDYVSYIVYRAEGYTIHENRDAQLDASWFTVAFIGPVKPDTIKDAMGWFDGTVVVIESEFDGDDLYLDLAQR